MAAGQEFLVFFAAFFFFAAAFFPAGFWPLFFGRPV